MKILEIENANGLILHCPPYRYIMTRGSPVDKSRHPTGVWDRILSVFGLQRIPPSGKKKKQQMKKKKESKEMDALPYQTGQPFPTLTTISSQPLSPLESEGPPRTVAHSVETLFDSSSPVSQLGKRVDTEDVPTEDYDSDDTWSACSNDSNVSEVLGEVQVSLPPVEGRPDQVPPTEMDLKAFIRRVYE